MAFSFVCSNVIRFPLIRYNNKFSMIAVGKSITLNTRIPLSSSFSTTTSNISKEDIQTLAERDHYVKIKTHLQMEIKRNMSIEEFNTLCKNEGLSPQQTTRFLQSLSDTGVILHFANSTNEKLKGTIFLKPEELNLSIHNLLEPYSPASLKLQAEATQTEIKELLQQIEPLKETRDKLEVKANRRANFWIFSGLGYCVLQFVAIGRLTWWELSWDVMEPVTYMLTFATAIIGYGFFVATGADYTYEGLKRFLSDRRLNKLFKKTRFDESRYKQLHFSLQSKEQKLHKILEQYNHSVVVPNRPAKPTHPNP